MSAETYSSGCVECPACGFKDTDDLSERAPYNDDANEFTCSKCEAEFLVTTHVTYDYHARALVSPEQSDVR